MYDVAGAALIVFPISGIFLWYKTSRNRLAGAGVLAAGLCFTAATILYLMYTP